MSRRDINRLIDIHVVLLRGVHELSLSPYDIYRSEVKDIKGLLCCELVNCYACISALSGLKSANAVPSAYAVNSPCPRGF